MAMLCAAGLGAVVALILLAGWPLLADRSSAPVTTAPSGPTRIWSAEVVRNLFVFACLAASNAGVQGYTVVALTQAWGMPIVAGAA
ncbi:hypothetical protein NL425_27025, partial [Klebsiella pneumoniae]|nr:hypothetical protein [Klebsiella pneumoniae]